MLSKQLSGTLAVFMLIAAAFPDTLAQPKENGLDLLRQKQPLPASDTAIPPNAPPVVHPGTPDTSDDSETNPSNPPQETPATAQSGTTIPSQGRRRLNPERLVIQAMMRLLVKQGIFPEHVYQRYGDGENPVVDKAHFADVMVKALGHDKSIVSEFPIFRDVSLSHWAYAPIEVMRERQLMGANHQGYFFPEAPLTRKEAYLIISRTVAGKEPSLELANEILTPFSDADEVPATIRPAIARLVNAKIIIPRPEPRNQLHLERKLRYGELAAILSREIEIKDYRRLLLPVDKKTLPQLPGGVQFSVVPNGAIYKNHLAVGDPIYFSVTEPVEASISGKAVTIPRGSRIDGALAATHQQFYTITFDGLQTPEGNRYRLRGELTLEFNTKSAEPFIVPGTPYTMTSAP